MAVNGKIYLCALMKKAGFIGCIMLFLAGTLSAQQKYGHINSEEVVQMMPEYKQMIASVEKKKKDAQAKMQRMYTDYQSKMNEMNQFGASMMEAVREEKLKELDSLQKSITYFQQTETSSIQEYQSKLLKPLNDKYLKIVNAVAKENGYTYIFDLSSGVVAYHPDVNGDISEQVKKKLGIN
jgi:outer membrane protein